MNTRKWLLCGALLAATFVTTGAPAQTTSATLLKVGQRWTPPLASHASRVVICEDPAPLDLVAMDDWVCPQTGPIIRVTWWGVLLDPGQRGRQYYVAIYLDNGNCQPGEVLYQQCLTAREKLVGKDCEGNRVWRFTARLPLAFQQTEGEHYWIQISEDDERSFRPGVEDFRWSAHRPIEKCAAVQTDGTGAFRQLVDPCDDRVDDLAFALHSRTITGTIAFPGLLVNPSLYMNLYEPATGDLLVSKLFEPYEAGSTARQGAAGDVFFDVFVDVEIPDATYDYEIIGMGMSPVRGQLTLLQGTETQLPAVQAQMGDLNSDCERNVSDLLQLLRFWGMCKPV